MSDNKVTIDDKEYDIENLSDTAIEAIRQIQNLNNKRSGLGVEVAQIDMALTGFKGLLAEALKEYEEPVPPAKKPLPKKKK